MVTFKVENEGRYSKKYKDTQGYFLRILLITLDFYMYRDDMNEKGYFK